MERRGHASPLGIEWGQTIAEFASGDPAFAPSPSPFKSAIILPCSQIGPGHVIIEFRVQAIIFVKLRAKASCHDNVLPDISAGLCE